MLKFTLQSTEDGRKHVLVRSLAWLTTPKQDVEPFLQIFGMIKLGIFPNPAQPQKDAPTVGKPQTDGVENAIVVSTIGASMSITVLQCDSKWPFFQKYAIVDDEYYPNHSFFITIIFF